MDFCEYLRNYSEICQQKNPTTLRSLNLLADVSLPLVSVLVLRGHLHRERRQQRGGLSAPGELAAAAVAAAAVVLLLHGAVLQ